jgi:hypothetical protein
MEIYSLQASTNYATVIFSGAFNEKGLSDFFAYKISGTLDAGQFYGFVKMELQY